MKAHCFVQLFLHEGSPLLIEFSLFPIAAITTYKFNGLDNTNLLSYISEGQTSKIRFHWIKIKAFSRTVLPPEALGRGSISLPFPAFSRSHLHFWLKAPSSILKPAACSIFLILTLGFCSHIFFLYFDPPTSLL